MKGETYRGEMVKREKEQGCCWKGSTEQIGRRRKRRKMSYCRQPSRKGYTYLRKDTIREMACLQINWN